MLKDQLKKLRESAKLTKKQVADAINVSERAYITYEYGQRDISTGTLQKLADFYDVSTDYLLGRPGAEPPKDPIDAFAKEARLKELEKILIEQYLELPDHQREAVLEFMRNAIVKEKERKAAAGQKNINFVQEAARYNPNSSDSVVEMVETTNEEEALIDSLPGIDSSYFDAP